MSLSKTEKWAQASKARCTRTATRKLNTFLSGATAFTLHPNGKGKLHVFYMQDTRGIGVHVADIRAWVKRGWIRRMNQPTRMRMYAVTKLWKEENAR